MSKIENNWRRFGLWVAQTREAQGLRQEDLGEKIGRDRQTIYRIEKGASTKHGTVIKIAEALHHDPKYALEIAFGIPTTSELPPVAAEELLLSLFRQLTPQQRQTLIMITQTLHQQAQQDVSQTSIRPLQFGEKFELFGIGEPSKRN